MTDTDTAQMWTMVVGASTLVALGLGRDAKNSAVSTVALLGAGLACHPLLYAFRRVAEDMAAWRSVMNSGLVTLLPMLLLVFLIGVIYGAAANKTSQPWPVHIPWVVVGGVIAGALAAVRAVPVGPSLAFGVAVIPLVALGMWVGKALRSPCSEDPDTREPDMQPSQLALRALLAMVIATAVMWAIRMGAGNRFAAASSPPPLPPLPPPQSKTVAIKGDVDDMFENTGLNEDLRSMFAAARPLG